MPSQIGRHEVRKELGRGMMGVVYDVYDPALGRTIALKTIRLAFGTVKEREDYERRKGRLKVWVDDERVLDEDLTGRVQRRILSLPLHKGALQESLALDPGRHEVRVQVSWDRNVKTSRISGTFAPGSTRRLDVEVGRLRRNLSLAWK